MIVSRLPAGGAAFLTALIEGVPLGAAAQAAFEETNAFDLSANLVAMIASGVFTAVQLGE